MTEFRIVCIQNGSLQSYRNCRELVNSHERTSRLLPRDGRMLADSLSETHRKPIRRMLRTCIRYKHRKLAYVSKCQADISPGRL